MNHPPVVVVSEEVKLLAETLNMTYSEVYDEMARITEEHMAAQLSLILHRQVQRDLARVKHDNVHHS